jgi:hypothetical protein
MPSLEPQAVQYAILDKDPVPDFAAQIKRMKAYSLKQLDKETNEAGKEQLREIQMTVGWDSRFKDVTGDKLYLLTKLPGNTYSMNSMMSNGPAGKKWVVTKVVHIKGKPVCWCIPVEVKTGKRIDVVFKEDNTFDMQSIYDKAMSEPAEGEKEPAK